MKNLSSALSLLGNHNYGFLGYKGSASIFPSYAALASQAVKRLPAGLASGWHCRITAMKGFGSRCCSDPALMAQNFRGVIVFVCGMFKPRQQENIQLYVCLFVCLFLSPTSTAHQTLRHKSCAYEPSHELVQRRPAVVSCVKLVTYLRFLVEYWIRLTPYWTVT